MNRRIFTFEAIIGIAVILFATNGYCEDVFVLSKGGTTIKYDSKSGDIEPIFEIKKYQNNYFPCYDKKNNTLYFESEAVIYAADLNMNNTQIRKVLDGKVPALSTDGKLISYWKSPNQIYVFDIASKKSWLIGEDAFHVVPAIWISDRKLLYITDFQHTRVIDVISKKISGTWPDKIIPKALSPDGKTVLCRTVDPASILLYNTDGSYVATIIEPGFLLKIGWTFVWSSDGRSFIYGRTPSFTFFSYLDTYDIFMFNIDTRKEKRIMIKAVLFGGVCIDSNEK